ncbi:hypothetical protein QZH41_017146 [Actinostola sp. cb2023]|nr:hypothetical protein QZH41_017146 [Actinostola sp. cb2023]
MSIPPLTWLWLDGSLMGRGVGDEHPSPSLGYSLRGRGVGDEHPSPSLGYSLRDRGVGDEHPSPSLGYSLRGRGVGDEHPSPSLGYSLRGRGVGDEHPSPSLGYSLRGRGVGDEHPSPSLGYSLMGRGVGDEHPSPSLGYGLRGSGVGDEHPSPSLGYGLMGRGVGDEHPSPSLGYDLMGRGVGDEHPSPSLGYGLMGRGVGDEHPSPSLGYGLRGRGVGDEHPSPSLGYGLMGRGVGDEHPSPSLGYSLRGRGVGDEHPSPSLGYGLMGRGVGDEHPSPPLGYGLMGRGVGDEHPSPPLGYGLMGRGVGDEHPSPSLGYSLRGRGAGEEHPSPSLGCSLRGRGVGDETLSNYFGWTIIRNLMPFLSTQFREAEMKYKRKATNTIASKPRWLQCIKTTDYPMGLTFAAGYLYIEKVFDKSFIPVVKSMMDNMRQAFREEVKSLSWIDETTRHSVFDKEEAMIEKIGFPKLCANFTLLEEYYSGLEVNDRHYLLNEVNVSKWYTRKSLSSLRHPVNRDSWYSGPQMVNAFYLRERNEINVMAGILQAPFFYGKDAPRVVNYGGIGMVLAHELTHGFDSAGRRFNKFGELTSDVGWTNHSMAEFRSRAGCIVDQYDKFELQIDKGTIHVDGKLTLDENIADNGGFQIAFRAYENWSKRHGPEKLVPGLMKSNEQMFFLSYAQMWCSTFTPSATFYRSKLDSHAIPKYRVKGVLINSEAFARAYKCPVGSNMNPDPSKRCRVW